MGITVKKIIRWIKMLTGTSIDHVKQGVGKSYSLFDISGYYNDLTKKVIKAPSLLKNHSLPTMILEDGRVIEFPTAIFQYGLGSYDLFLQTNQQIYFDQFMRAADWAIFHQESNGGWDNFSFIYPTHKYCGMAQGEGCSLLLRAYKHSGDKKYLKAASNAVDLMVKDVSDGGTTLYKNGTIILEYTNKQPVLNGWIFAIWGLYEICKLDTNSLYKKVLNDTVQTLEKKIDDFSMKHWSYYNLGGLVASPFYHNLHVAQMEVLFKQTKINKFKYYANRWNKQNHNVFYKLSAFFKKARQKIAE